MEESFDLIIMKAEKILTTPEFKNILKKEIIKPTYGFDYEKHFRPMLIKAVGLKKAEEIEINLDKKDGYLLKLKSNLGSIITYRNTAAHTHVQGTTPSYPAPSTFQEYLLQVHLIMDYLYSQV